MAKDESNSLLGHYKAFFGADCRNIPFVGARRASPAYGKLAIFRFDPDPKSRASWIYATEGLSPRAESTAVTVDVHLFADQEKCDQSIAMILTALSDYVRSGNEISDGHIVNFGQPIISHSKCEFGLVSLPYCFGPEFERFRNYRCLWLIPITATEREFALERGLEALEQLFESRQLQYWDLLRNSLV